MERKILIYQIVTKYFSLLLFIFITTTVNAQEKNNAIFFTDLYSGGSFGSNGGGNLAFSANYQQDKNIFTYRYIINFHVGEFEKKFISFFPFTYVFAPIQSIERSFLYGKRYINNNYSYSFLGGISHTKLRDKIIDSGEPYDTTFFGFPFEMNIRWFNAEKSKFKLLGIIPIGKENPFSAGGGIKLIGNISKKSYIGIGITLGFGYYKNYK